MDKIVQIYLKVVNYNLNSQMIYVIGFSDVSTSWLYNIRHFGFIVEGYTPGLMSVIHENEIDNIIFYENDIGTTVEDVKNYFGDSSVIVVHCTDIVPLYTMEQYKTREELNAKDSRNYIER